MRIFVSISAVRQDVKERGSFVVVAKRGRISESCRLSLTQEALGIDERRYVCFARIADALQGGTREVHERGKK